MSARHFGIGLIARRSLRAHAVSSTVTAVSLALAGGLAMSLVSIAAQSRAAFTAEGSTFDAVLGARGSQLQLVLNAVFHLETSPGNIPWSLYESVRAREGVRAAIPLAVGDSWRGYRVVGTVARLFDPRELGPLALRVAPGGRVFDETLREVVAGSYVARRTGLSIGSRIQPQHGLAEEGGKHEEEYVVVGILEPTSTPNDRALFIPIEGMFRMGGHVLRGAGSEYRPSPDEDIPDEAKELSAVLLELASPAVGVELDREINREGREATLAWPVSRAMAELFDKLGWMSRVLSLAAWLAVLVGAASILASLHNAMNERRREFAILRAIGARRATLFASIVAESASIAALGALGSFAVHAGVAAFAAHLVRRETGVALDPFALHPVLCSAPVAIVALGALAGLVPAWKAYRTDVAENLAPLS